MKPWGNSGRESSAEEKRSYCRQGYFRWRLLVRLFALALAGYCLWAYAQERHDLPPFDPTKAQALSPQTRAEYERLLFNEIPNHNAGTKRHDIWSREKEWLRMADEGFELAHLTLRVLSPTKGKFALDKPLNRLESLAEQGDAGAMCLYRQLVTWGQQSPADFEKYNPKAIAWMERGSTLGHPECLATHGAILLRAPNASKEDRRKGFDMLVTAARAGYAGGAYGLIGHFIDRNKSTLVPGANWVSTYKDLPAIERETCWHRIIKTTYDHPYGDQRFEFAELEYVVERNGRRDIAALLARLKKTNFTLETCIDLGLGD